MNKVRKWYIGVYGGEAQARACGMGARETIRASAGETFTLASDFDRVTAECDALRQRLTASADLLEIWRTWLGPNRESCDEGGKQVWDRIDSLRSQVGVGNDA
ncbi:hypothetical protein C7A10_05875 [Pseudomonas fluorescens]|uniref:Uncharacterized protein n=1 Tax=Pseudomonas fluorescens TaxID=294 RepID=A0A2T0IG60_PSEFL|nr:hypothetical protein C7A10_05875 [Pseudomonas fluorescens]